MAFMGIFFMWIAAAVLIGLIFFALLFFVIGLILRKKHKIAARVMFVLAGINLLIVVGALLFVFLPHSMTVETPDGKASLKPSWISEYNELIEANDIEGLDMLFDRHPDMIYYYDVNRVMPLDYGLYNTNIELMQCAIDHGAVFDDPLRYDHMVFCNSLSSFFSELDYPAWEKSEVHETGVTTDDIIETVRFAIDHGASPVYKMNNQNPYPSFYEHAEEWVKADGAVSPKDRELLKLIKENLYN